MYAFKKKRYILKYLYPPTLGWLTKFSDVVGASHSIGESFWKYGDPATNGMRDVAEHGATQRLEDELKQKVVGKTFPIKAQQCMPRMKFN